jgi:hypothetical protein
MGNTEIAQKRKERRIKKKKRNYNYFMHVHGHTHPWLKREQMHVCLSSPIHTTRARTFHNCKVYAIGFFLFCA